MTGEMLGPILLSWHNIAFYQNLMSDLRAAIEQGQVREFRASRQARWQTSTSPGDSATDG
jgi:queuine tRNA-ribosyltransferase